MVQANKESLGIKLLSIAGGLLGSGFFLGFLIMSFYDVPYIMLTCGILVMAGVIILDKTVKSTFMDTACIGAYLAAYAMIGLSTDKLLHNDNLTTLILLFFAIIVPLLTKGYMLNFIAVLAFNSCLFVLIGNNKMYFLIHLFTAFLAATFTYLTLYKFKLWRNGFLFSFIALLIYEGLDFTLPGYSGKEWISSIIIIVLIAFILNRIIAHLKIEDQRTKILIYMMSLVIALLAIFAPAICGAFLILLVSFHVGHRTGLAVAIIALVYFTGQYYYNLNVSLLVKSEIMFATGILFLAAWFAFKNTLKRYEHN